MAVSKIYKVNMSIIQPPTDAIESFFYSNQQTIPKVTWRLFYRSLHFSTGASIQANNLVTLGMLYESPFTDNRLATGGDPSKYKDKRYDQEVPVSRSRLRYPLPPGNQGNAQGNPPGGE